MRKRKPFLVLLLIGCIFLTGCGKKEAANNSQAGVSDAPETNKNSEKNNSATSDQEILPSDTASQTPETPVPTAGVITTKQGYNDSEREVSILGLKEYKKLKSDKYTDKAKKGKKFLVLFLKVRNRTDEKIYFNVNYLSAKVDGKKIENTVLFNEPEGYPTIFSNIVADSYYGGFIVWEVPENWKKLEVTYNGWRDSNGLTLNSTLTKKDLSEPEEYSKYTYDQSDGQ